MGRKVDHSHDPAPTLEKDSLFFTKPDAQILYLRHLLHSSTYFEHYYAHLQEDSCISTESGIVTVFG